MNSLQRAIALIAGQRLTAYVYDSLTRNPDKVTLDIPAYHPEGIIAAMNVYYGDTGKSEQRYQGEHPFEGIDVYSFQNGFGTKGAIAITNDANKARRAFVSLGLMEGTEKDQKRDKGEDKPDKNAPPKTKLPILVIPGLDEDGADITKVGINSFLKQTGLALKVTMNKRGKEYWYYLEGNADDKKFGEFKEKMEDYLKEVEHRWETPKKTSNTGDYSYEKTYI